MKKMWCYNCKKLVDWNYNDPHHLGWSDYHCSECNSSFVDRVKKEDVQRVVDKIAAMKGGK